MRLWLYSSFSSTNFTVVLGQFAKHSPTTREWKGLQGENLRVFPLETLKNLILNEKLYP